MERTTARGNRLGLLLSGLVLLVLGGLGLAVGLGAFGPAAAARRIIGAPESAFFAGNPWIWWALAALAVILALLGLRWLLAQSRTSRLAALRLAQGPTGVTEVESGGVTRALESDVSGHPAVSRAHATLTGGRTTPGVRLRVTAHEDSPVDDLRRHLDSRAIPRMREALEVEHLPAVVQLRLDEPGKRVRAR